MRWLIITTKLECTCIVRKDNTRRVCSVTCGKVPSTWRTVRQFVAVLEPEDFKRVVEWERTLWARNGGDSREEETTTGVESSQT